MRYLIPHQGQFFFWFILHNILTAECDKLKIGTLSSPETVVTNQQQPCHKPGLGAPSSTTLVAVTTGSEKIINRLLKRMNAKPDYDDCNKYCI